MTAGCALTCGVRVAIRRFKSNKKVSAIDKELRTTVRTASVADMKQIEYTIGEKLFPLAWNTEFVESAEG